MKTTLKRVLSIALALVLVVGVLPMGAQAATTITKPNPDYTHSGYGNHREESTTNFEKNLAGGTKHGYVCKLGIYCSKKDTHVEVSELHFDDNCDGVCDFANGADICGVAFKEAGHTLGTPATCTTQAVCSTCGQSYGVTDPNAHQFVATESVCQREGCDAPNPNYAPPVVKGDATILVRVNEAGTTTQKDGGSFTIVTDTDGEAMSAVKIREQYSLSNVAEYTPAKIYSDCVTDNNGGNRTVGNETINVIAGNTYILWLEVEPTTPPATSEPTTPPATSEPTTPPASTTTKYNVSYNLNVDETSKYNYPLAPREEGTRLATIMQELRAMEGTTIKFPGLFETWFEVEGWYVDGIKVTDNDTRALYSNTCFVAKWKQKYNYEVVLKLYTNGNTNTVVKVIDAFKYVQDDGKLSHTEVTNIAKEYIKPNNDAGLTVYGPFDASGWEQYSLYSNRLTGTEYVTVNPNGTTVVHAMVHNALINGSSSTTNKKADSSNPKTGDMIMVPAAIMGTTVSALAVMFYLKKKRTV